LSIYIPFEEKLNIRHLGEYSDFLICVVEG
jgi:hypothetical protein